MFRIFKKLSVKNLPLNPKYHWKMIISYKKLAKNKVSYAAWLNRKFSKETNRYDIFLEQLITLMVLIWGMIFFSQICKKISNLFCYFFLPGEWRVVGSYVYKWTAGGKEIYRYISVIEKSNIKIAWFLYFNTQFSYFHIFFSPC